MSGKQLRAGMGSSEAWRQRPAGTTITSDVELVSHADQHRVEQMHLLHAAGPRSSSSSHDHVQQQPLHFKQQPEHRLQQQRSLLGAELHHIADELQHAAHATHDYIIQHHRGVTTFLIAVTRLLDQTDATLLPAVYFYVG